ncbi:MAG: inorganic diphosphatase [Tissierellaceae bacterium]|nr:inorganic diphosphatase [Tissierellaceae bacterium]
MKMENTVKAFIEIPRGSSNKYEYDKEKGEFFLDRTLYSPMFYPTEYGFIPETLGDDGDPLDIMVLTAYPTFPGCTIESRVIGMLLMIDQGEGDEKIIAVPVGDPRYENVQTIDDVNGHLKKEIEHFFSHYKDLQKKEVQINGWAGKKEAFSMIEKAKENYKKSHK